VNLITALIFKVALTLENKGKLMKGKVYIAAGGTGGHINGALALGQAFSKDEFEIHYISGKRFLDFKLFLKEENVTHLNSWPLRYKNPLRQIASLFFNSLAFIKCFMNFIVDRPTAVIGCGGYVCGPVLMAAKFAGAPCFIIEQNACAGVTNKILANICDLIFVQFEKTKGLEKFNRKISVSGNPIRVLELKKRKTDVFTVLVFGGSLGAEQINTAIASVLNQLTDKKIKINHQGGKESKPIEFENENIDYEHFEYIDDIYSYYETADLVISRAGASSVSELMMLNTNCILIPYPKATDNHQVYNAAQMKETSSCEIRVLDSTKSDNDLQKDLYKAVLELLGLEKSLDLLPNNSAQLIKSEITNYVFRK
jgi:UDP-N-acetylglucosamine--N-acetylmuramyl-(pentapeptide) pyrophosphoryl-undecaprenol N-acetylglucosamine transferase